MKESLYPASPRKAFPAAPRTLFVALLFGLLITLFDLRSLGREFVWDDQFFIAENQFLQSFTTLPKLFTTSITEGAGGRPTNFYRPLQAVTHLFDVQLFGLDPWWHHISNILLHALMGALLFLLVNRILAKAERRYASLAALGAVALWIFHPLQAAAVGYLSGRGDILVGVFAASAALAWPRRRWLAAAFCALAMLSKESGILTPAFVVLVDLAERRPPLKSLLRPWIYLPLAIPALTYLALRLTVLNLSNTLNFYNQANVLTENYSYRVFTFFTVFAKSLQLIFWPVDIHHERSWLVYPSFGEPLVLAGATALALILLLAWRAWPRARLVSVGLAWFLVGGLPTSNLIALINALIYDHWFLLPAIGFMFAAAYILHRALNRFRPALVGAAWLLLLVPLLVISWHQLAVWTTARSLYEQILQYEPRSSKIMNNLGMIYAEAKEPERAEDLYRRSLELNETPEGRNNLGNLLLLMGKYPEAERELRRALEIDPGLFQAATNLGRLRLAQGDCAGAEREFRSALRLYADPAAQAGLSLAQRCQAEAR
jgi:tetratricopeptide (TPR) repeat protein